MASWCRGVVYCAHCPWAGSLSYRRKRQILRRAGARKRRAGTSNPAPRGIIYDSEGDALVENKAVFTAVLNAQIFLSQSDLQSSTLAVAQSILGVASGTVSDTLQQSDHKTLPRRSFWLTILIQTRLVNLQALALPTITIQSDFERVYPNGPVFSSVIGYTGRVTSDDLKQNTTLAASDIIGKTGIEAFYNSTLQGVPGIHIQFTNAQGNVLQSKQQTTATLGSPVKLTIDGGLQTYLYNSIQNGLRCLADRSASVLRSIRRPARCSRSSTSPDFDNNAFSAPASSTAEIRKLSHLVPISRCSIARYPDNISRVRPSSRSMASERSRTGIITPDHQFYSPGYLMVPNPYNPSTPTKYLDWESHGGLISASALAQSSDVYFYIVGRRIAGIQHAAAEQRRGLRCHRPGCGITDCIPGGRRFGLGKKTGIDLPSKADGFLPTTAWRTRHPREPMVAWRYVQYFHRARLSRRHAGPAPELHRRHREWRKDLSSRSERKLDSASSVRT